jgi:hypothetical protein
MSKCEQCIVREFSSLKALNKDELVKLAGCKTSRIIEKEKYFEEGENVNGIFCIKDGFVNLLNWSQWKDHIVKLVSKESY